MTTPRPNPLLIVGFIIGMAIMLAATLLHWSISVIVGVIFTIVVGIPATITLCVIFLSLLLRFILGFANKRES